MRDERTARPRAKRHIDESAFLVALADVRRAFKQLIEADPVRVGLRPSTLPTSGGVYLISEPESGHLYVGRTRNVRTRIAQHTPGGNLRKYPRGVSFAVQMTREITNLRPTYQEHGGLPNLFSTDKRWRAEFRKVVARIRDMDVRCVLEPDPIRQELLELYTQIVLATPYNSHGTT